MAPPPSPWRKRAATKTSMPGASPPTSRPTPNTTADAIIGARGPRRSDQMPAATIPTMLAARVAENVAEYQARPSRSALTVGMIVVTAIASNANRKIRLTMPTVAQRYGAASSGVVAGAVVEVTPRG